MKRNIALLISALLAASLPILGAVSAVQAESECSLASLKGTFGASATWFTQGTGAAAGTVASRPAAQLGIVTFDGAGSWVQEFATQSNNGVISSFLGPAGTYTVDSKCIATLTNTTQTGNQTIKFVIATKDTFLLIPTPNPFFPGWVPSGAIIVRTGDQTCSLSTVNGIYGFSATGFSQGTGAATATVASLPGDSGGIITVDGGGGFSLEQTTDSNGTISSVTTTGTYTVNPNCTGSSIDSLGGTTNFVIVAKGNQVLFISTTPGTVATGALRKLGD